MAIQRENPYGNARFAVEIDGIASTGFSEVRLPEMAIEIVRFREGSDQELPDRKLAARPWFGSLVLKRGFNGSLDLYEWWRAAARGDEGARRSVRVVLQNEAATESVAEWRLRDAWPALYYFSHLEGGGCEVLTETMEVACESVEIE